jgi:DNA-binding MarR family transcriptional regulator
MAFNITRTRYAEPSDSVGYLLHQLASLWRRHMNARLSEIGLTHTQFVFLIGLAWLTRTGDDVTQKDLGRYHKASRALTSRIVRLLERNGLLMQVTKPNDARAKLLRVTPKGFSHLKRAVPMLDQTEDDFLAEYPPLKRRVRRDLRAALAHELTKIATEDLDHSTD